VEPHARGYQPLGRDEGPPWERWARQTRERILAVNRATLSPLAAGIAGDFLIGDPEPPDPDLADHVTGVFRASATIHLLVVSGTQVTLVLGPFIWLGRRWHGARFLFWLAGCGILAAYFLLTDRDPPVARAGVMGLVLMAGLALERELDLENCLGFAALVLFVFQPLLLFDIGFQLSFAAVWALVRLAPSLYHALKPPPLPEGRRTGLPRAMLHVAAGAAAACAAAHLGVAPILAMQFQQSSWSGILANVPMGFAGGRFIYLAIAHAGLGCCGIPVLAPLVEWHAAELYGWARFFAAAPFGAAPAFPFPAWLLPLSLAGIAAPSLAARLGAGPAGSARARVRTLALAAVLGGGLFLLERLPAPPPPLPTLRALDVGQGDALLLQAPDGTALLVDAGPPRARVAAALRALRVPALDAVLVSHPHADHIGGLPEVLEALPVGALLHSAATGDSGEWRRVLATAAARGIPVLEPRPGERLRLRKTFLTVLGPLPVDPASGGDAANEQSLVVRWDAGGARFLLAGDVEQGAERTLLRWGPELRADVLKVAHHGSRSATGMEWLRAVRPRAAVISCGRENRHGHPAEETLLRLELAGVPVARTDLGGTITVQARPGACAWKSWLPP
jgi:competence protein ComEC